MLTVVYAVVVLGLVAAVFGFILAYASKVFAVKVDEREEAIASILPGANCGGCGYAGCGAYAAAIAAGKAPTNACAAGGNSVAAKIAEIMGTESSDISIRNVAFVKCAGGDNTQRKFDYLGLKDCLSASRVGGTGPLACPSGCLGYGSCVAACPFGHISVKNGVAVVDHENCVGCMACADACPKHLIVKVPYEADINISCSSKEKGAALRKYCNIGCLGCHICEKTCQHDAIHVIDNLAVIDHSKCTSCGECVAKCPRHLIHDARLNTEGETPQSAD